MLSKFFKPTDRSLRAALYTILGISLLFTILLVTKSLLDFSRTGPEIRNEILAYYSGYVAYAISRLALWTFAIAAALTALGVLSYASLAQLGRQPFRPIGAVLGGGLGLGLISLYQFLNHLLYTPSQITASWNYSESRLFPLWEMLSPGRLLTAEIILVLIFVLPPLLVAVNALRQRDWRQTITFITPPLLAVTVVGCSTWAQEPPSVTANTQPSAKMNVLMIGSDTLRADHLGLAGYPRDVSPFIDSLATQGVYFSNCFVPLARTAPSLASFLTGTWPHDHGIRDNYISDEEKQLPVTSLPKLFNAAGYNTVAIGDWAAGDLGKVDFGFKEYQGPGDQWNIKFLVRQGPKDLRLFLSLFTNNYFGRMFLPELYYLAGTPLTHEVGLDTRHKLSEFAASGEPFFMTTFIASTHAPFGSPYPYYLKYTDPNYRGESKFAMGGLIDPSSIIKAQELGKESFDVDQIIGLYDGAIRSFDDEVRRIVEHLKNTGLDKNTIIVIFSDHGMDFFERSTWGQGNTVLGKDPSARVPLLIIDPRAKQPGRIDTIVRSIDLAPTLTGLTGISETNAEFRGVSLAGVVRDAAEAPDLHAYHETGLWLGNIPGLSKNHLRYPSLLSILEVPDKDSGTLAIKREHQKRIVEAKDRMLRTNQWKLIYFPMEGGAEYWLYDTIRDPNGDNNLIGEQPQVFNQLKDELINWMSQDPLNSQATATSRAIQ